MQGSVPQVKADISGRLKKLSEMCPVVNCGVVKWSRELECFEVT